MKTNTQIAKELKKAKNKKRLKNKSKQSYPQTTQKWLKKSLFVVKLPNI
jgi:hypothetical protein